MPLFVGANQACVIDANCPDGYTCDRSTNTCQIQGWAIAVIVIAIVLPILGCILCCFAPFCACCWCNRANRTTNTAQSNVMVNMNPQQQPMPNYGQPVQQLQQGPVAGYPMAYPQQYAAGPAPQQPYVNANQQAAAPPAYPQRPQQQQQQQGAVTYV
jgi:hypothetical protein